MSPGRGEGWLSAGLLALLLVLAPLPFGGVVPWATASLAALALLAFAAGALTARETAAWRTIAWPAAALVALALLGALQSLAWPRGLVEKLSPEHLRLAERTAAVMPLEVVPPALTLSLAPGVSRAVAVSFLAVAAALAAAGLAGSHRGPRRLLTLALALGVGCELLHALRGWFAVSRSIWGIAVESDATRMRGTFVNPNHLATYLEIALAAAFALAWWALRRARYEVRIESKVLLAGPPLLLWAALFACLAFTGSRAGMAAAVLGTMAQAGILAASRRSLRPALLGLGLGAAGLALLLTLGVRQGFERWLAPSSVGGVAGRLAVYGGSLELWQRFPVLGTGLGTFREGFPAVQPPAVTGAWWHAHSDWLELLVTAGVAGLALLLLGLAALARRLYRVLTRGARSEDRAAALAACGALTAVGLHELFDFGLTMPANALTLAVVVGAACGARVEERTEES